MMIHCISRKMFSQFRSRLQSVSSVAVFLKLISLVSSVRANSRNGSMSLPNLIRMITGLNIYKSGLALLAWITKPDVVT